METTISVEMVERALEAACRRAHAEILEFTVAPRGDGYDWLIEFAEPPRAPDLFPRALDETLRSVAPSRVIELPAGTFHRWRRHRAGLGRPADVPRLATDHAIADGVLAVAMTGPVPLIAVD
jgi:hypothetical protein